MVVFRLINNVGVHNILHSGNAVLELMKYGRSQITHYDWLGHYRLFSGSNVRLATWKPSTEKFSNKSDMRKCLSRIPKITLLSLDNTIIVTSKEQAEKISKRQKCILKKEGYDTKHDRDIYRLVKSTILEDLKNESNTQTSKSNGKESAKKSKIIQISSRISDHDFSIKLNKIYELLQSKHNIKVYIAEGKKTEKHLNVIQEKIQTNGQISTRKQATGACIVNILTNDTK